MGCIVEPNSSVEYVAFMFYGHTFMVHKQDAWIGCLGVVLGFVAIEVVTQPCTLVAFGPIDKLGHNFLGTFKIINATKVILPIVLVQLEVEQKIHAHLNIWKLTCEKTKNFCQKFEAILPFGKFWPKNKEDWANAILT